MTVQSFTLANLSDLIGDTVVLITSGTSMTLLAPCTALVNCAAGNYTLTLPATSALSAGEWIGVKKTDTSANTLTITPQAGTIDGAATLVLPGSFRSAVRIFYDGTNWWVLPGGLQVPTGTSGGIPFYSSTSALGSSAALGSGLVVTGGGAGTTPATIANGQLPATATNDNAAAGKIGEYVSASVLFAARATFVVNAAANLTSISLTAGDWDIYGSFLGDANANGGAGALQGGFNTTSATPPDNSSQGYIYLNSATVTFGGVAVPPARVSLAAPGTVYLALLATGAGNLKACGMMFARRVR